MSLQANVFVIILADDLISDTDYLEWVKVFKAHNKIMDGILANAIIGASCREMKPF